MALLSWLTIVACALAPVCQGKLCGGKSVVELGGLSLVYVRMVNELRNMYALTFSPVKMNQLVYSQELEALAHRCSLHENETCFGQSSTIEAYPDDYENMGEAVSVLWHEMLDQFRMQNREVLMENLRGLFAHEAREIGCWVSYETGKRNSITCYTRPEKKGDGGKVGKLCSKCPKGVCMPKILTHCNMVNRMTGLCSSPIEGKSKRKRTAGIIRDAHDGMTEIVPSSE